MDGKGSHSIRIALVVSALVPSLGGLAAAQATPVAAKSAAAAAGGPFGSFGTNMADGVLWGGGPEYKVRFDAGAVQFTPALGLRAERNMPLTLTTLSVTRGADVTALAAVAPRREGDRAVLYDRAPGIVERHDVRTGGLELSFRFESRPAGHGDLVVRLQVQTELAAFPSDGGLRFERPDVGGVGVGAVKGIDAQGHRVDGAVRLAGDVLELMLPGAFVDAASYPLLLDPFIFPITFVAPDLDYEEGAPDVAYDSDLYLVVWEKVYSASDIDIRGQLLDTAGAIVPFGYWFLESASNTVATRPQAASLRGHARFMIVWQQAACVFLCDADVVGCSLSTAGFGQSAQINIAAGGGVSHDDPDVGGHSKAEANVVSVVWEENDQILHRNVLVDFVGDPSLIADVDLLEVANRASEPTISKGSGEDFEHLVVWKYWYDDPAPGDHDLHGTIIDVLGEYVAGIGGIVSTTGLDERQPDLDGDGDVWGLVYSRAPNVFSQLHSVHAVRVFKVDNIDNRESVIADEIGLGLDNRDPAVAFTGNGFLVAWSRQYSGTDYDIALVALDPWAATIADPLVFADFTTTYDSAPALASRFSNEPFAGDGALCAWQVTWFDGDDDVWACAVDPELGIVTDLGGATLFGGKASVSAATVGNPGFTHFYDGLYPSNGVTLLVGVATLDAPFCTGTLVPNPLIYLPLVTGPDTTLVLPTPLPADPLLLGVTLYEQYSEKDLLTSPCSKKIQLSNALSILIQ
jgi:hypothetical protein